MEFWTTFNETTEMHEVRGADPDTGDQVVYFSHPDFKTAWHWLIEHR